MTQKSTNAYGTGGHKYDDIINLPHHISRKHPQMSLESRAAQFAPFAALTGFDAAIDETARQNEERIKMDEKGIPIEDISNPDI